MFTTSRINIILAATIFTLSSSTFFMLADQDLGENARILILPLLFFGIVVALVLLFPKRWPKRAAFFSGEGSAIVWLVPLFTFLPSLFSSYGKSFQYWLLDFVILVLCRLYSTRVPLRDVLEGLFWSGAVVIAALLFLAGQLLIDAINTLSRFSAFGFHPNTLAFILATYFAVALWQISVGPFYKRVLGAFIAVACFLIIFLASSRGTLVATVAGGVVVSAMYCVHERKFNLLLGIPVLLCLAIVIFVRTSSFGDAWESIDQVLQISGGERGIGSGMSGRLTEWHDTWGLLRRGSWLYGNGVRSSDNLLFSVDNGFLVLLHDMGIVPFFLIVGRFVSILWQSFRRYMTTGGDLELILFFLLLTFLLNNVTARYLFGVGNPFSLFAVMLFASPWVTLSAGRSSVAHSQSNPALDPGASPA